MAIKGSLKEASLPDVLQLLALGQKSGCLSIADRSNFGYIYFERGRISYASIVNRRDRLGDILVKHGTISPEQLDTAIHRQFKERDRKLGEILVGMGVLTQEDLERYMRVQIEESVYYLFTWTQGSFNFEADVRPDEDLDRARSHEPVNEVLREHVLDLGRASRPQLLPVAPRVVDVDVAPILVRRVAAPAEALVEHPAVRPGEVTDPHAGGLGVGRRVLVEHAQEHA